MSKAADQAYSYIRGEILSGQLAPGSPLREENLADASGVSRTPVREALRRLEVEQLVQRTDSKRCYVADWSPDDIEEGFVLRAMLEAHAVSRAASRISAEQIAHLQEVNDRILQSIASNDTNSEAFADLNREFHATIGKAAQSERLEKLLAGLVSPPVVLRTAATYDRAQREHSVREHDELIRALQKADEQWAQAIMVSHIRRAYHSYNDAFQAYLSQNGDAGEE